MRLAKRSGLLVSRRLLTGIADFFYPISWIPVIDYFHLKVNILLFEINNEKNITEDIEIPVKL